MAVTYEKIELGTVVGPQGAQGAQGVQGPAGPQGPTGPQGPAGGTFTSDDVKEFVKEVTESYGYMKKVADSDLDMNGKSLINALVNIATHMTLGTEGNAYGGYQITTAEQLDDFNETGKVKWAKVTAEASPVGNDGILLSIGWRKDASRGYCRQLFFDEANHNIYSRGQSNGVWRDWLPVLGNTSSAINSMGSNYIRYENGLQICWGSAMFTELSAKGIPYGSSGLYQYESNQTINFPQPFIGTPICVPEHGSVGTPTGGLANTVVRFINKNKSAMTTISILYTSVNNCLLYTSPSPRDCS